MLGTLIAFVIIAALLWLYWQSIEVGCDWFIKTFPNMDPDFKRDLDVDETIRLQAYYKALADNFQQDPVVYWLAAEQDVKNEMCANNTCDCFKGCLNV
jgi:hypothetical protein